MTIRAWQRLGVLACAALAAPLALAQEALEMPEGHTDPTTHWAFMLAFPALAMLLVIGIIAVVNYAEYRKQQNRLASIERLMTAGHPVPRELIAPELARLTLPEQYRHDLRRGITLFVFAIGVALVFYFTSGGQLRPAAWGFLFLLPSLGNFAKAWFTAREIARGGQDSPQK